MRFIAELADSYALHMFHRQKSSRSHFKPSEHNAWASTKKDSFFLEPEPIELISQVVETSEYYIASTFSIPSQIENGKTNEIVKGLVYEARHSTNKLNLILVHGWRMSGRERLDKLFLEPILREGYNLYQFTLPYHMERSPESSAYSGELMISADIDRTLHSVQQAVSDLRALIHWLKTHRSGKVVLIGVSLGGLITNLTATLEERFDGLVSLFYANSLPCTIWETTPGKYIKRDFEKHGFNYEDLKKAWAVTIPSNYKPLIPKNNILLLSASYDKYIAEQDSKELWLAWDQPRRILYPYGHSGIVLGRKALRKDILTFLRDLIE